MKANASPRSGAVVVGTARLGEFVGSRWRTHSTFSVIHQFNIGKVLVLASAVMLSVANNVWELLLGNLKSTVNTQAGDNWGANERVTIEAI